jgi:hypothetical protein
MEKGLNRFKTKEIEEDNANQSRARLNLTYLLDDITIKTQEMMSFWDWEFYKQSKIVAIGEYRRRFIKFGTFEDFQFSKKKFDAMVCKGQNHQIPAYMFVEFNDLFMFFKVEGDPIIKTMRRNHEVRTEDCVCIPNESFKYIYELEM